MASMVHLGMMPLSGSSTTSMSGHQRLHMVPNARLPDVDASLQHWKQQGVVLDDMLSALEQTHCPVLQG
jgi:hypothetical protein